MTAKPRMSHVAKAYSVALSTLVPGSAIWSMVNSCPVAAGICAILVIALAVEQFRITLDKKAGNSAKLDELDERVLRLQSGFEKIDMKEFIARSDEVRVVLNSMKTHNPYRRPLG